MTTRSWFIYTIEYYAAVERIKSRRLLLPVGLAGAMLSEISQVEKDRYRMIQGWPPNKKITEI